MIRLGDLIVFIAVLVIVAVFLKIVHFFISNDEPAGYDTPPRPPEAPATRANTPDTAGSEKISESQSVSR